MATGGDLGKEILRDTTSRIESSGTLWPSPPPYLYVTWSTVLGETMPKVEVRSMFPGFRVNLDTDFFPYMGRANSLGSGTMLSSIVSAEPPPRTIEVSLVFKDVFLIKR